MKVCFHHQALKDVFPLFGCRCRYSFIIQCNTAPYRPTPPLWGVGHRCHLQSVSKSPVLLSKCQFSQAQKRAFLNWVYSIPESDKANFQNGFVWHFDWVRPISPVGTCVFPARLGRKFPQALPLAAVGSTNFSRRLSKLYVDAVRRQINSQWCHPE